MVCAVLSLIMVLSKEMHIMNNTLGVYINILNKSTSLNNFLLELLAGVPCVNIILFVNITIMVKVYFCVLDSKQFSKQDITHVNFVHFL